MTVRLELNSSENVILCTGDTSARYTLSDISLEYDAIFDEPYATGVCWNNVNSVYEGNIDPLRVLKKQDTTWKIDVNNLAVGSLQGLLLIFLTKRDNFANKNEEFYNPSINKVLVTINGMPYQLLVAALQARDIYPELKKYFYEENSEVTWKEFLTTKFALWIDTRSSIDKTLHGSGRAVNQGIMLQIEKASETSDDKLMRYIFSLEDAVAQLSVSDPSGILTIEKYST